MGAIALDLVTDDASAFNEVNRASELVAGLEANLFQSLDSILNLLSSTRAGIDERRQDIGETLQLKEGSS